MKPSGINTILSYAMGVLLIISAFFCYRYVMAKRDNRRMAFELRQIQFEQTKYQSLFNDCLLYSEKNPAINPILESVGLKQGPNNPSR